MDAVWCVCVCVGVLERRSPVANTGARSYTRCVCVCMMCEVSVLPRERGRRCSDCARKRPLGDLWGVFRKKQSRCLKRREYTRVYDNDSQTCTCTCTCTCTDAHARMHMHRVLVCTTTSTSTCLVLVARGAPPPLRVPGTVPADLPRGAVGLSSWVTGTVL